MTRHTLSEIENEWQKTEPVSIPLHRAPNIFSNSNVQEMKKSFLFQDQGSCQKPWEVEQELAYFFAIHFHFWTMCAVHLSKTGPNSFLFCVCLQDDKSFLNSYKASILFILGIKLDVQYLNLLLRLYIIFEKSFRVFSCFLHFLTF